jgi:hypothetical protein
VRLHQFQVQVWESTFHYHLRNWIPFSQQNLARYDALETEVERIQFLERILTGNILAFGKGIGWWAEKRVEVGIMRIHSQHTVQFKGLPMISFTLDFRSNASLPYQIGLGKGVSLGYGVVDKHFAPKQNTRAFQPENELKECSNE